MTQYFVLAGSAAVDLLLLLVVKDVAGVDALAAGPRWAVGAVFVAVFVVTVVAWLFSPLPDGSTFGGVYGTGWGFGTEGES
jgi:hypothetical protein